VVAAGIRNDAAGDLRRGKLENLVGRTANLECADGLKAFGLEPNLFVGSRAGNAWERGANERCFYRGAGDAGGGGADGSYGDEGFFHTLIISFGRDSERWTDAREEEVVTLRNSTTFLFHNLADIEAINHTV